mgnify:FL=1
MHMKSGETNVNSLEYCFNSVRQWFLLNGLQLNPDKSEAIQLGTAAKLRSGYRVSDISLGDHRLTLSSSVKTLGVQIDRALSFTEHVDTVCKSSRFHINALRHIRNCVDLETAKDIASSIVGSRIDYCNSLLYGISNANQHKLQLLQNTLARVVTRTRKYDHITPVLRNLHWLPITARINYKIAVLTYKLLSTNTPSYLSEVISVHHPSRQLRSAANRTLSVPYVRTQFGARAFRHAAPTIWNSLPASITSASSSLATFKRDLKTSDYKQSFPC